MAQAIADKAFATTELPVMLSMEVPTRSEPSDLNALPACAPLRGASEVQSEGGDACGSQMHCTPSQQRTLTFMLVHHLRKALLPVRSVAVSPRHKKACATCTYMYMCMCMCMHMLHMYMYMSHVGHVHTSPTCACPCLCM